jgi:hypothetical protein
VIHWRYTSAGGVTEDIIRPVVSVSLEIYLCWWSQKYIYSETLITGRMISSVTPPAEVYLQ